MKRILFSTAFLLICANITAQHYQLIDVFQLTASEGGFGIYADIDTKGEKAILIDMDAPNATQKVQLQIASIRFSPFIKSMKAAKDYFLKWNDIAKKESVVQFSKDIPIKIDDQIAFFTSDKRWHRELGIDIQLRFYVDEDGHSYLVLETDYMTSEEEVQHGCSFSNAFSAISGRWALGWSESTTTVTHYCPGASLFFSSGQEIDTFISKLNNVKKWKDENISSGALFN